MFDHWIKCVAIKGVKQMKLRSFPGALNISPSLFACHLLADLRVSGLGFTGIPTGFQGFLHLKECYLRFTNVPDDRLQQLISLCPILQKLGLSYCYQLMDLKICSSSLKFIAVNFLPVASFTVDCPQLTELKVFKCHDLHKLELNSRALLQHPHSLKVPSFERHGAVKLLKKLSIVDYRVSHCLILHGIFPELEELDVAAIVIQDMTLDQMVPRQELTT
ncbi:hypothetical protein KI387_014791, partial [Taxus chinensis]